MSLTMGWMTWPEIQDLIVCQTGQFVICIFTSFIFVYLLLKILSPKIVISPNIYKKVENGTTFYIFKIINKSRFDAYNVKFFLARKVPYIVDGVSVNHTLAQVALRKSEVFSIPKFKKQKHTGDYAALIATDENIELDMGSNHIVYELYVSSAHGLSNITKVTKMQFKRTSVIFLRAFVFGNSLKISD